MREIKFRVFDLQTNDMYKVVDIDFVSGLITATKTDIVTDLIQLPYDSSGFSILMQFTGLKDKNGKDIFEGDIISAIGTKSIKTHDMSKARLYVNSNIKDIFNTIEKKVPFLCVWDNSFSSFEFRNTTYSICSDVNKRDIEVIGNIHQNLELLK